MRYLIPILLLFAFASCRTMKKNSHSTYNSIDSSSSVDKTENRVLTDKTVKVKEHTGEKSGKVKIVLEYGNNKIETNLAVLQALKKETGDMASQIITALPTGLTKATIEGDFNSVTNSKTTVNKDTKDSVAKKENTQAEVKKKTEEVIKNKQVTGVPWYATTLFWVILVLIAIAFIIYKKSWFMKILKNLIAKLLLISAILFVFSCNNPSNEISGAGTEWSGNWEVLPGADKPTQVNIDYVYVQPTWGQSFYFSMIDDGGTDITIAIVLFIVGIFSLYKVAANKTKSKGWNAFFIILGAVGIIGALVFAFTDPGTIKWNTNIKIEKAIYEKYKADDNLKGMWNRLYMNKRIVGASGEIESSTFLPRPVSPTK